VFENVSNVSIKIEITKINYLCTMSYYIAIYAFYINLIILRNDIWPILPFRTAHVNS